MKFRKLLIVLLIGCCLTFPSQISNAASLDNDSLNDESTNNQDNLDNDTTTVLEEVYFYYESNDNMMYRNTEKNQTDFLREYLNDNEFAELEDKLITAKDDEEEINRILQTEITPIIEEINNNTGVLKSSVQARSPEGVATITCTFAKTKRLFTCTQTSVVADFISEAYLEMNFYQDGIWFWEADMTSFLNPATTTWSNSREVILSFKDKYSASVHGTAIGRYGSYYLEKFSKDYDISW
ncbi:hypothetical protein EKG37_21095 [Robertmurraya yapensis]|uniref:Uncharacterized protein n=1 Tax=Bacillus yapensis TaxID=2492960 RepID=A0A3S0I7H5_9BACI|nr:hypothetical protein [Bacillus yapensis]RTR26570.1 hypothetical protein EKG37_21095 [Bacillus yapensis]TKS93745.1 hypothetical protein FAR12_21100 [Bacillus yapensis]